MASELVCLLFLSVPCQVSAAVSLRLISLKITPLLFFLSDKNHTFKKKHVDFILIAKMNDNMWFQFDFNRHLQGNQNRYFPWLQYKDDNKRKQSRLFQQGVNFTVLLRP